MSSIEDVRKIIESSASKAALAGRDSVVAANMKDSQGQNIVQICATLKHRTEVLTGHTSQLRSLSHDVQARIGHAAAALQESASALWGISDGTSSEMLNGAAYAVEHASHRLVPSDTAMPNVTSGLEVLGRMADEYDALARQLGEKAAAMAGLAVDITGSLRDEVRGDLGAAGAHLNAYAEQVGMPLILPRAMQNIE